MSRSSVVVTTLLDPQQATKEDLAALYRARWNAELDLCSQDQTVRLWQVDSGACQVLPGHTGEVFAAASHPDCTRLATAGGDRAIWL